jgi:hypothetical protein
MDGGRDARELGGCFLIFAMTASILYTRLGCISAGLVLPLRGIQQERTAAVEPAAEPRAGLAHAAASVDTT